MEYVIRDGDDAVEVFMRGRLTFAGNEHFRGMLAGMRGAGGRPVTMDLSGLEFIDSAGLGLLLLLRDATRARLALRNPQGQVRRLLAAVRFGSALPIQDGAGADE